MDYWIGCYAHKQYSQFAVVDADGQFKRRAWGDHEPGAIK